MPYVLAADLIDLRDFDPGKDRVFRRWLRKVRTERLAPRARPTLIDTHEFAANNWGTHAGASRIAADAYLGDRKDLARAAAVFKGYTGDRSAYAGFNFGDDQSWQADPAHPVPIVHRAGAGAACVLDGALPDDMRRGCARRRDPCPTRYPWEAMQGIVAQAEAPHPAGLRRVGLGRPGGAARGRASSTASTASHRTRTGARPAATSGSRGCSTPATARTSRPSCPPSPARRSASPTGRIPSRARRSRAPRRSPSRGPCSRPHRRPQPVPRAEDKTDEGAPVGAIVGGVAAGLAVLGAIALLLARRRSRQAH